MARVTGAVGALTHVVRVPGAKLTGGFARATNPTGATIARWEHVSVCAVTPVVTGGLTEFYPATRVRTARLFPRRFTETLMRGEIARTVK